MGLARGCPLAQQVSPVGEKDSKLGAQQPPLWPIKEGFPQNTPDFSLRASPLQPMAPVVTAPLHVTDGAAHQESAPQEPAFPCSPHPDQSGRMVKRASWAQILSLSSLCEVSTAGRELEGRVLNPA